MLRFALIFSLVACPALAGWESVPSNMEELIQKGAEVLSSASIPYRDDAYDIHTYLNLDGQLYRCVDTFAIKHDNFAYSGNALFHSCFKFK